LKDSFRRQLLLPESEIFSGCDRHAKEWKAVTSKAGSQSTAIELVGDWSLFLSQCEALLEAAAVQPSPDSIDCVAAGIARVAGEFYRAGFNDGVCQSANLRAEKARVAKCQKANERGRIVQQAIAAVCTQQKLTPAASEKFAMSIQADVIATARQFGLSDARSGTSPRSLQRHIAALLKDIRMA
jgi:hypothetical protein